jgi:hypothetical protein
VDPKILGAKIAEQKAQREAKNERFKDAQNERAARHMDSIEQGKAAMEKTVIPYVREIQAASPEAEVSVEISSTDVNDSRPVAVEIRIGSKRIELETNAGHVSVRKITPAGRHNLSGSDISTVADLTRENLGRLFDKVLSEND